MARKPSASKRGRLVIDAGKFPPSVQVLHFTDEQWEQFIEECCRIQGPNGETYTQVKRLGGPGDGGRDVEARLKPDLLEDSWDLYQAKHYRSPLAPSEFFPELAKFFQHVSAGTYPCPKHYYLCAPLNAGNDLHDLIAAPEKLKARLLQDWQSGTTGLNGKSDLLTEKVRSVVEAFNFARIREVLTRDLIDIHSKDEAAHFQLFHIEPKRGDDPAKPFAPANIEQRFVEELIKVYSEKSGELLSTQDVMESDIYSGHFDASRAEFYCAEGLRRFSRDIFPEEFPKLLQMVLDGVRSILKHPKHNTGFERLDAVMEKVSALQLTDSKLFPRLRGGDLPGTCHHLANDGKITWTK